MKILSAPDLRNVAVVGHNTVGKTTLVAAMLYASGAMTRPGRIEEGTCPTDFDGEEIERKISINLACAHAIHRDTRINFLDAPGYGIFSPEARAAVAAADAAIIVLDAVSGVEVQTEKAWKFAEEFSRPVLFVVNRMDRERASFERVDRVPPEEVRPRTSSRSRSRSARRRPSAAPSTSCAWRPTSTRTGSGPTARSPTPSRHGPGKSTRGSSRWSPRGRRPHGEVLRPGDARARRTSFPA